MDVHLKQSKNVLQQLNQLNYNLPLLNIKYKKLDATSYGFELFWRGRDKIIKTIDKDFLFYFYTIPDAEYDDKKLTEICEKIKQINAWDKDEIIRPVAVEIETKTFENNIKRCIKVSCNIEKDVLKIKEKIKSLFPNFHNRNHDIRIISEYLVEKKLNFFENYTPKVCAFDIECYSPELGAKGDLKNNPITMIGFYSEDFDQKCDTPPTKMPFSLTLTWKPTNAKDVEVCKDEKEMLVKFFEIINSGMFDIFVTYNGNEFDLPSIKERADFFGIREAKNINIYSRGWRASSSFEEALHVDLYDVITKHNPYMRLSSYSLDNVAKESLKQGKKEFDIAASKSLWDGGNIEEYIDYNKQDAKLTYLLAKKFLPVEYELSKLTLQPIDQSSRQGFSRLVEEHLIARALQNNYLVPPRPKKEVMEDRYEQTFEGGFVLEPKPGLYKDVVVLDFRSLYPSIISTYNIDAFTKAEKTNAKKEQNYFKTPDNKYFFVKKPRGFISFVIDEMIKKRIELKKILNKKFDEEINSEQIAVKILTNATYGYLGFIAARWYCLSCAEAATVWGRYYLKQTISQYEAEGFKVIYGDTDSLMVLGDEKKILNLTQKVNKSLPGIMHLKQEDVYKKILFAGTEARGTKKRYAAINLKGDLIIKGFEFVRGDWCELAKKTQKQVIEMCLNEEPERALTYVKSIVKKLKNKEIPIDNLVIYKKLARDISSYEQTTPHVAVAKLAKKVSAGDIVSYIIIPGKEMISQRARQPGMATDYDFEYYINNQIIPSALRILSVFGYKRADFEMSVQKFLL